MVEKRKNVHLKSPTKKPSVDAQSIDISISFKSDLERHAIKITRYHKLTSFELNKVLEKAYDSEKGRSRELVDELLTRGTLETVNYEKESLIRPSDLSAIEVYNWQKISRSRSKAYVDVELTLPSICAKPKKMYMLTHLVKSTHQETFQTINPPEVVIGESKYIQFSTNDYLGMSKNSDVIRAAEKALLEQGVGAAGSRILTGTCPIHTLLEDNLKKLKGTEACITFNSGFMANLALLNFLPPDCAVIVDSIIHTSVYEGIKMGKNTKFRFRHNDADHLREVLSKCNEYQSKLVVVEGIYSMDGDICPLDKIVKTAKQFGAYIAVDEAHSTGTFGANGKGVSEHFQIDPSDIDFHVGTLSKAFGGAGGFIACNASIAEVLRHSSVPYLFSVSIPMCVAAGVNKAVELVLENPIIVQELQEKAGYTRTRIKELGFDIGNCESHIIPVITRDYEKTQALQSKLADEGVFASVVTYPAVPKDLSRLRVNVCRSHTQEHIDQFISKLEEIGKELHLLA